MSLFKVHKSARIQKMDRGSSTDRILTQAVRNYMVDTKKCKTCLNCKYKKLETIHKNNIDKLEHKIEGLEEKIQQLYISRGEEEHKSNINIIQHKINSLVENLGKLEIKTDRFGYKIEQNDDSMEACVKTMSQELNLIHQLVTSNTGVNKRLSKLEEDKNGSDISSIQQLVTSNMCVKKRLSKLEEDKNGSDISSLREVIDILKTKNELFENRMIELEKKVLVSDSKEEWTSIGENDF